MKKLADISRFEALGVFNTVPDLVVFNTAENAKKFISEHPELVSMVRNFFQEQIETGKTRMDTEDEEKIQRDTGDALCKFIMSGNKLTIWEFTDALTDAVGPDLVQKALDATEIDGAPNEWMWDYFGCYIEHKTMEVDASGKYDYLYDPETETSPMVGFDDD